MPRMPAILISPTTRRRTALLGAFVAIVPFVGALAILIVTPTFSSPMFAEPPSSLGIPYEVVIFASALAWGAIGGYVVGTARSRWVLPYVLLFFTIPAIFVMVFAPAVVLMLQNLLV